MSMCRLGFIPLSVLMYEVFCPPWDPVLMKDSDSFWISCSRTLVNSPAPSRYPVSVNLCSSKTVLFSQTLLSRKTMSGGKMGIIPIYLPNLLEKYNKSFRVKRCLRNTNSFLCHKARYFSAFNHVGFSKGCSGSKIPTYKAVHFLQINY